ncbi:MAG: ParB/RepB/Spo0J family partition protein [Candidatus Magasanikbacteria bacterium]|jgi:ParB family transcriptional regulator, chromosome partitioning protein|nr:ParB/RepB/Spo0J family partition protein [Candidatus Magasanikbacteria bacterium]MBT4220826.1 ParB/RepB/Spo0J family partition protein [Candidatus Magasanikbacteria bacterium]MBT4350171.1 ParB/RepB/Spo0J family partition protein [Candidatus Magasanikbacteria bacterium]MBT4541386.1 ParB/RepB/Spo0J family partition protein [Candidatus Magasanikbacteria bacterium]MBT6253174.1 ParB/RepB/Spo0J family partition protein [Candidatus Magasanikbacteria bacterium]
MALGKGLGSLIPQHKTKRKVLRRETSGASDVPDGVRVIDIPLTEIVPNSEQPRKHFDHHDLESLVASIKKHGILQPVTVTEKSDGSYELIAGERRFRSSQIAGLVTIPAIVRSVTDQEKLELALIENIQRQQLNSIEEAFAYRRLMDAFGLTQQQVADQVGKKRPTVANTVRLLDLPSVVQKALIDGQISAGKARALLSLKDEKEQLAMFKSMIGESMTVREVEQVVARKGPMSRKGSVRRDPNLLAQEQLIEERLGTKVHITKKGEKGKIEIEYYSKEELKRLISELS